MNKKQKLELTWIGKENGRAKPSPLAMQRIEELLRSMGDQGSDLLGELTGHDTL